MRIKVHYLGLLRDKVGKKEEELEVEEDISISGFLEKLTKIYGESLESIFSADRKSILDPSFVVTVNDVLIGRLNGMETRLKSGDEVSLMSLISGG